MLSARHRAGYRNHRASARQGTGCLDRKLSDHTLLDWVDFASLLVSTEWWCGQAGGPPHPFFCVRGLSFPPDFRNNCFFLGSSRESRYVFIFYVSHLAFSFESFQLCPFPGVPFASYALPVIFLPVAYPFQLLLSFRWWFYSSLPCLSSVSSFLLSSHVFLEILCLCVDLLFIEGLFQEYFKFTVMWLVTNFIFYSSVSFLWQHFSGDWFLCYCFYCYFPSFLLSCVSAC